MSRRANDILLATAFNSKQGKTAASQSRISHNHSSAHSARSRSNVMRTRLGQFEKPNYNQSFNEYDRDSRRLSRQGNRSLQEDHSFSHQRDHGPNAQGQGANVSSRKISVEQEREIRSGNVLGAKTSLMAIDEVRGGEVSGANRHGHQPSTGQQHLVGGNIHYKNSNLEGQRQGASEDGREGDQSRARGVHNPAPKEQPKFTNHEWPANKEYIDIGKLKTEHIKA